MKLFGVALLIAQATLSMGAVPYTDAQAQAAAAPAISQAIAAQTASIAATYATQTALSAAIANAQTPIGSYTVATLPACTTALNGKLAYDTDLGGGPNNVKCVNGSWQHLSLGMPQNAASGAVTVTPLTSAPIQIIPAGATSLSVNGTPYPGEPFYVVMPTALSGTTTSLGLTVNGVNSGLALLPGKTYFLVANASGQLVQVQ